MAKLIWGKIDFKLKKNGIRDKQKHYIKSSIQQEDIIKTFTEWQTPKIYEIDSDRISGGNKQF